MKRKSLNAQKINHNFISNLLNKDFIKPIFSKFEKKLNNNEIVSKIVNLVEN